MQKKQRLSVGDLVCVEFGTETVTAVVTEIRGDHAFVEFTFEGADEPIRSGYRSTDLVPA